MNMEEEAIQKIVIRINAVMNGLILGLLFGAALFVATNWLVLKGGPEPGRHLSLLSQYFPGYSVTFIGSLVGFLYAFVTGFITGFLVGVIYNKIAR